MAKKIGVLCEQFFTQNAKSTDDCLFGGGEKYLVDFVSLLKNIGYYVDCYQFSVEKWNMRYKNMSVKGLGNIILNMPATLDIYMKGIKDFNEKTKDAVGTFLLSMNLALQTPIRPTLTCSHGLMFDNKINNHNPYEMMEGYKRWIRNTTKSISVDSNSIHAMQIWDSDVAKKFEFIPNYVDINSFKPSDNWLTTDRFRVLYARRLQDCRGYHLMMPAIDKLLKKYDDMDFIFCGRGNKAETDHFMKWYNQQDMKRVKYTWREMKDMPSIYKEADVSVVPTTYAEGSSLSALESLASGVPLISTYIGGLSDITQNYVNGLLIKPDSVDAIIEGIEYMYHNRGHLRKMRENALNMIPAFSKTRWDTQITKIVKEVFGEP